MAEQVQAGGTSVTERLLTPQDKLEHLKARYFPEGSKAERVARALDALQKAKRPMNVDPATLNKSLKAPILKGCSMPIASLTAVPDGADLFLDANIFIYGLSDQGQETLTVEQFEKRFGWKNDPTAFAPTAGERRLTRKGPADATGLTRGASRWKPPERR